jgi:hypothetical protein
MHRRRVQDKARLVTASSNPGFEWEVAALDASAERKTRTAHAE